MSHNRAKGRKSNKPSFNVRKNLVNSKIQSTFSVPTRKKSEKHAESLLESGHYDGITSFNPHGQRITLEDAVVSLHLHKNLTIFHSSSIGIENPLLGIQRGWRSLRLAARDQVQ